MGSSRLRSAGLLVFSLISLLATDPVSGKTIYVDADATGDGSGVDWVNACTTIGAGLLLSATGDEVWVAAREYRENLVVTESESIYGGFVGGETSREQRDPQINETVIDGNRAGSCVRITGGNVLIDGLSIRSGSAESGGGLHIMSAELRNPPTAIIDHCRVSGNSADLGGGVCSSLRPHITFRDCVITGNSSRNGGGFHISSTSTIERCLIQGNVATEDGGGIWHSAYGETIRECTIASNTAQNGGGIYQNWQLTIWNSIFLQNEAGEGGAAYVLTSQLPQVYVNCLFIGNVAGSGTAVYTYAGQPEQYAHRNPLLTNCTFVGNRSSSGRFYAMYGYGDYRWVPIDPYHQEYWFFPSLPLIQNCVVWNETERYEIFDGNGHYPLVTHSNVRNGFTGEGNIDATPEFVVPWDGSTGDFHLQPGSPCIDSGSNDLAAGILTDLDGNLRVWDGNDVPGEVVDMGAYEFGSILATRTPTPTVTNTPTVTATPTASPTPEPGDLTGNGIADANDLYFFSQWWHQAVNETNFRCDAVDDGTIDEEDLVRLLSEWR